MFKFAQTTIINILLGISLIILTSVGVGSYYEVQKFNLASEWVSHTYEVIGEIRMMLLNAYNADLYGRDYMVTGNQDELNKMNAAFEFVDTTVNHLERKTIDNPVQTQNIIKLKPLLKAKEDHLRMMTKLITPKNYNELAGMEMRKKNISLLLEVSSAIDGMISLELGLLQNRTLNSVNDSTSLSEKIIVATLLSDLLLILSFFLINYHLRQRNLAQRELHEMGNQLKRMIDGSRDLIAAVDTNLNFIAFNTAYENKYAEVFDQKLKIGMNIREALNNIVKNEEILNSWNRAISGDDIILISRWDADNSLENSHYYEITFNPIFDSDHKIIGATNIMRDVTERMKVDQMKNEFVSIVSHELRTPLTSIRGSLGLLVSGASGDFDDKTKKMLNIAFSNCERLIHLINDILDISKIEAGGIDFKLTAINIQALIEEAIIENQPYCKKFDVNIEFQKSPTQIFVHADYGRLMQVLTNLISNAVKFSRPGGEVIIDVTPMGGRVRVSVIDHGEGIAQEFEKLIFQKFAQEETSSTRKQSGTGLGLSISKAIIEKLHGEIGYTTKKNQGSTFFFDLPVWVEATSETTEAAPPLPLPELNIEPQQSTLKEGQSLKILYVEDDSDLSEIVRSVLENEAELISVPTNKQAKEIITKERIDLVLLDLVLADDYGANLIPELTRRKIPIIIFSAYDLPQKYLPFVVKTLVKSQTSNQQLIQSIRSAIKSNKAHQK